MIILLVAFSFAVTVGQYVQYNRLIDAHRIERASLQSKIDTLTEALVHSAGKPLDLNVKARDMYKRSTERMFSGVGWKRDNPATPKKEN